MGLTAQSTTRSIALEQFGSVASSWMKLYHDELQATPIAKLARVQWALRLMIAQLMEQGRVGLGGHIFAPLCQLVEAQGEVVSGQWPDIYHEAWRLLQQVGQFPYFDSTSIASVFNRRGMVFSNNLPLGASGYIDLRRIILGSAMSTRLPNDLRVVAGTTPLHVAKLTATIGRGFELELPLGNTHNGSRIVTIAPV